MNILVLIIAALTVVSVASAVILVRAAFIKPRIGALTERAIIAVLLAFFGCVYTVVALDTELGRAILTSDVARLIVRCAVILIHAIPTWWTYLYLTGRLGGGR